jgi:hypothetical protein
MSSGMPTETLPCPSLASQGRGENFLGMLPRVAAGPCGLGLTRGYSRTAPPGPSECRAMRGRKGRQKSQRAHLRDPRLWWIFEAMRTIAVAKDLNLSEEWRRVTAAGSRNGRRRRMDPIGLGFLRSSAKMGSLTIESEGTRRGARGSGSACPKTKRRTSFRTGTGRTRRRWREPGKFCRLRGGHRASQGWSNQVAPSHTKSNQKLA